MVSRMVLERGMTDEARDGSRSVWSINVLRFFNCVKLHVSLELADHGIRHSLNCILLIITSACAFTCPVSIVCHSPSVHMAHQVLAEPKHLQSSSLLFLS